MPPGVCFAYKYLQPDNGRQASRHLRSFNVKALRLVMYLHQVMSLCQHRLCECHVSLITVCVKKR